MDGLILLILGVIILFAIIIVFFVYKSIKSIKNDNTNNSENDTPEYFYYQRPRYYYDTNPYKSPNEPYATHTPYNESDITSSQYEDIKKALTILKSFAPPAFPFYDYKKWYSQNEINLRQYLKYINIILREEDLIVPVIQYIGDTDADCPGYTYNKNGGWIYIKNKYKQPSLQYQCYHILIHEYMHHYLRVHNLNINNNKELDELLTDCAVIYFGFEDIYQLGRKWEQDHSERILGYIKDDNDLKRLLLDIDVLREVHKNGMMEYWCKGNKLSWNRKS